MTNTNPYFDQSLIDDQVELEQYLDRYTFDEEDVNMFTNENIDASSDENMEEEKKETVQNKADSQKKETIENMDKPKCATQKLASNISECSERELVLLISYIQNTKMYSPDKAWNPEYVSIMKSYIKQNGVDGYEFINMRGPEFASKMVDSSGLSRIRGASCKMWSLIMELENIKEILLIFNPSVIMNS